MFRAAVRSSSRALPSARAAHLAGSVSSRRFLSTAPAPRKGTWKGAALRWGLAIGAVYYYNTSPIFADELPPQTRPAPPSFSDEDLPTVDAIVDQKRKEALASAPPPLPVEPTTTEAAVALEGGAAPEPGSPEALEEEASQQGAFNPETGEINWDCPCLGGMANGSCGEEFKAAFSCFVYSDSEPKGMDCIDKFQHMQDCFRRYPEEYGSELADDEDDDAPASSLEGVEPTPKSVTPEIPLETSPEKAVAEPVRPVAATPPPSEAPVSTSTLKEEPKAEKAEETAEFSKVVPKHAYDSTDMNKP